MNDLKRRVTSLISGAVLAGFAVWAYLSVLNGGEPEDLSAFVIIWLIFAGPSFFAARLLVAIWWDRFGARLATMDCPAQVLAIAVSALPDDRREWAAAMEAELAQVHGRRERWWFAADAARAALFPPRGGPRPILIAAGAAGGLVVVASLAVGRALPALHLVAVTFTTLVGGLALLAVARRPTIASSRGVAVIVGTAVAGCIGATAYVLAKYPTADDGLGPVQAVFLATALVGCLWLALMPPGALTASRPACWMGIGLGIAICAGLLWSTGFPDDTGQGALSLFIIVPPALYFVGSMLAALIDGSFRSGFQTAVVGAIISVPLVFAIWLLEAARWYESGAGLLVDNDGVRNIMAANIEDAVFWDLIWMPIWALPFGIFGAALGGWERRNRSAARRQSATFSA